MSLIERTEQVERDLEEILEYLDNHSPSAANRFAKLFQEMTEALARMPEMGRSREELASGLRSFTIGNYVLFYRPMEDGIQAIRIAHGSRDLPSLFDV
jgi:toxin ParE1/3/4